MIYCEFCKNEEFVYKRNDINNSLVCDDCYVEYRMNLKDFQDEIMTLTQKSLCYWGVL